MGRCPEVSLLEFLPSLFVVSMLPAGADRRPYRLPTFSSEVLGSDDRRRQFLVVMTIDMMIAGVVLLRVHSVDYSIS